MFKIRKLSQQYNPLEDRIKFAIQNELSEVVVLWVSRRVAKKILKVLGDRFAFMTDSSSSMSTSDSLNPTSPTIKKLAPKKSSFKDEVDSAPKKLSAASEAPVKDIDAKEFALLHSVNFNFGQQKIEMIFKWGVTGSASIVMDIDQLKIFADGLKKMFELANWLEKDINSEIVPSTKNKDSNIEEFEMNLSSILTSKSVH